MRKLVSVRTIDEIREHSNADSLELAIVDGWQVIIAKGKHHQGETIAYFEIDSFIPVREEFEFLRKSSFRNLPGVGEGFRIKTIKLRKELSQGLVMPLSEVLAPEQHFRFPVGSDLSKTLGVVKYEKPIDANLRGYAKGNFPERIPKTDQERVQNIFKRLRKDSDDLWEVTLKLDGSSMTCYVEDFIDIESEDPDNNVYQKTGVCSRNLELQLDQEGNHFVNMFHELELDEKLREARKKFGFEMAIQGEIMGPGIQGNREGFEENKYFVFDIYDITRQEYVDATRRMEIISYLELTPVPTIGFICFDDISDNEWNVDHFLKMADIRSINHKIAEGIVFKNLNNTEKSFKVINNKYLLKCDTES